MRKTIYSRQSLTVGRSLREIRENAGLTQRQLCRKLEREHSFISKCELGERRIDIVEFYWICAACGVSAEAEAQKIMKAFADMDGNGP